MTVRDLKDAINACTKDGDENMPVQIIFVRGLCNVTVEEFDIHVVHDERNTERGIVSQRYLEILV